MKALKVITIIILFMSIYTMVMIPLGEGSFPGWINIDMMQLMLLILCVTCVLVLIKR